MPDALPYLDAFPTADEAAWRSRVASALKGRSADTLASRTYDAIPIAPLYPPAAAAAAVLRAARSWAILARLDQPDATTAGAQTLEDLGNGADGLQVVIEGALGDHGSGLPLAALDAALADVVLDAEVPIELDALDADGTAARALAAVVARRRADPAATRIAFGIDPLGFFARGGGGEFAARRETLGGTMHDLAAAGFSGPVFAADARLIHAAGGSEAQELAFALGAGLTYLRLMDDAGVAPEEGRRKIAFRVAVDPDEFLGIAKLRALRRLWAAIEEGCGLVPAPIQIHAETAWRSLTRRDPDVNMIRATLAVFAAATGGADRITVLPHTQALGVPDALARRVARNTQLVLREEANLDKVADPAAGSGGLEALTSALCETAWAQVQAMEVAGGLPGVLADGSFAARTAEVASARTKNVARRRDGITGVSEFAAIGEAPPPALPATGPVRTAFAPRRIAEPFEALRDRADAQFARTGTRPRIFLATLGTAATAIPRATFARNLAEAGGFETIANVGDDTPEALAAAFTRSGARIACLCAADATYATAAVPAAQALTAAGAHLLLAGRPGEQEAALRAAGVRDFAAAGSDVLALLEALGAVA